MLSSTAPSAADVRSGWDVAPGVQRWKGLSLTLLLFILASLTLSFTLLEYVHGVQGVVKMVDRCIHDLKGKPRL